MLHSNSPGHQEASECWQQLHRHQVHTTEHTAEVSI